MALFDDAGIFTRDLLKQARKPDGDGKKGPAATDRPPALQDAYRAFKATFDVMIKDYSSLKQKLQNNTAAMVIHSCLFDRVGGRG